MEPGKSDADPLFRKQCRRENVPGHAHFLTFSCFQRRPFLSRDRSRQWLIDAINTAQQEHQFDLWAYVIMPEHVHLLLLPRRAEYDISAILSTIKQPVARCAVLFVKHEAPEFLPQMLDLQPNGRKTHRFWQRGGGYDRNLYGDNEIWEKIRYVHHNPVTRGLVEMPEQWLWSSASDYAGVRDGPLKIDWETVPPERL